MILVGAFLMQLGVYYNQVDLPGFLVGRTKSCQIVKGRCPLLWNPSYRVTVSQMKLNKITFKPQLREHKTVEASLRQPDVRWPNAFIFLPSHSLISGGARPQIP